MQKYPVRTRNRGNLAPEALARILRTHFESVTVDGASVSASYGAIERLTVRAEGRDLSVEVSMNPKVLDEVARETIARYNRFLEETTGFSTKERAKRLRKSATAAPAGD
ncbi:MAG TPA: DUF5611 family protein [Thermoplasmata archaeon]|nr:DUF5611 family protein [Thermoplasmata archaeon]